MTGTPKVISVDVARYVQDCMSCPFLYDDDYVRSCGHDNAPKDYNQCRILYSQKVKGQRYVTGNNKTKKVIMLTVAKA